MLETPAEAPTEAPTEAAPEDIVCEIIEIQPVKKAIPGKDIMSEKDSTPWPKQTGLITHARMYSLADQYQISSLKLLARSKFEKAASEHWDHDEFPVAVRVAYTTTLEEDTGLRKIVIQVFTDHMELLNKPAVEASMRELNGLSYDLLKVRWNAQGGLW